MLIEKPAAIGACMLLTHACLLLGSSRYRSDHLRVLGLELSTMGLAARHPMKFVVHVLSFALPAVLWEQ